MNDNVISVVVIFSIILLIFTHAVAYYLGSISTEDRLAEKACTSHYPDATYKAHKLCVKKLLEN